MEINTWPFTNPRISRSQLQCWWVSLTLTPPVILLGMLSDLLGQWCHAAGGTELMVRQEWIFHCVLWTESQINIVLTGEKTES